MQSSGASLFTFFLGQIPNSIAIIDTWLESVVPSLSENVSENVDHVIAKAVITTTYSLSDHVKSFDPDVKILFVRHPYHNYVSLSRKVYGDFGGHIDDKFSELESVYAARDKFDVVVSYESFLADPQRTISELRAVGIPVSEDYLSFNRKHHSIVDFNIENSHWCRSHFQEKWGLGNIKDYSINPSYSFKYLPKNIKDKVYLLCPLTTKCSDKNMDYSFSLSYILYNSIFNDLVARRVRNRVDLFRERLRESRVPAPPS